MKVHALDCDLPPDCSCLPGGMTPPSVPVMTPTNEPVPGQVVEKPQYVWGDHEGNNAKSAAVMAAEPRRRYSRVADAEDHIWERGNTRWTCLTPVGTRGVTQVGRLGWSDLVTMYGPITITVTEPRTSRGKRGPQW